MLRLWRLSQGGMGAGHLPENCGSMGQSTKMMEAFAIMGAFEAELRDSKSSGRITKTDVADIRANIDRTLEQHPDGEATGVLLAAVMKSRNRQT